MRETMITVEAALRTIGKTAVKPRRETIPLGLALYRVLAQDVVSKISMPPFHKSAMDGYALNSGDASDAFRVIEMIPAGVVPKKSVGRGQCAKIMTGGMVPRGADRVVRRELTVEENGIMRLLGRDDSPNICRRGEDVKPGDIVLLRGSILRPQEIGILASLGAARVDVYVRPAVGLIATGSEIVAPGRRLSAGRIYDSNSFSLSAQVEGCGAVVKSRRRTADSVTAIRRAIASALERCDLVLVSGGVSAGDLDFVPAILRDLGVGLRFERIAVQPGKPTVFGTRRGKVVFGVPGNPVSTFVVFEVFIKPLLFRMMGHDYQPMIVRAALTEDFLRKRTERAALVPVHVHEGAVALLEYHGSAHIHALGPANGLLYVPRGLKGYAAGDEVHVRLLS
ncbi:MAG: molybdopterin molybdotransferase MoeA [Candidatus Aminicenantes bacterium]|nr:molybdopterin molybdotransferase MoeA [Candidatus Aminicenantes bacterium]